MVYKSSSAEPSSPTTPSGSNKVTIDNTPTEIPDVPYQDINRVIQNAEEIASSLQSDTSRAKDWLANAKLALEVANRSLDEAAKLAHNVEKIAEDTAGKMKIIDIGTIDFPGKEGNDDVVSKGSRLVEAVKKEVIPGVRTKRNNQDLFGPNEVVKLQLRALQIQSLVDETREQVNQARERVAGKTTMIATGMKEQVANLSDNLEMSTQGYEELHCDRDNSSPPVNAKAILKGETPTLVDHSSLDKIDRVYSMRKSNSLDTTAAQAPENPSPTSTIATRSSMKERIGSVPEETQVDAEDLLKKKGAVKADSASLDKIDGLPVRTHNSKSCARIKHTSPSL